MYKLWITLNLCDFGDGEFFDFTFYGSETSVIRDQGINGNSKSSKSIVAKSLERGYPPNSENGEIT